MSYSGKLTVQVIEGKDMKNRHGLGHTHPQVKLSTGTEVKETKRSKGESPSWNETLVLNILPGQTTVNVTIEDEGIITEKAMAHGTLLLDPIFKSGNQELWLEIRNKDKFAGSVKLICYFQPTQAPMTYAPAPVAAQGYAPTPSAPPPSNYAYAPAGQAPPVYGQPSYPPPQQAYGAPGYPQPVMGGAYPMPQPFVAAPPVGFPQPAPYGAPVGFVQQPPFGAPAPYGAYPPPGQYYAPPTQQGYPTSGANNGYPGNR